MPDVFLTYVCLIWRKTWINANDLSPDLFNIYINKIIKEWKEAVNNGIQLNNKNKI
jgi:hypothetical protein